MNTDLETIKNEKYFIEKLCSIKGLNGQLGHTLYSCFGSFSGIFKASEKELSSLLPPALVRAVKEAENKDFISANEDGNPLRMRFTCIYDEDFPKRLKRISDCPLGLWHIGDFPSDNIPSVAIIGARKCSPYGEFVAKSLGSFLGEAGVSVVSGLARGVDGISQAAALSAGGTSYGVLGSGADVCYPSSNRVTYNKLKESGGIISLYAPGEAAMSQNFPPRNRIVSGLADAVVVVEAKQKSGTLITVDMALEQGREVFVVPGRITDRTSDGCNALLSQGASVFLSPEIFLCELNEIFNLKKEAEKECPKEPAEAHPIGNHKYSSKLQRSEKLNSTKKAFSGRHEFPEGLSDDEIAVLSTTSLTPKTTDEILASLPGFEYATVAMILMQLLIAGHVDQVSQGSFVRVY